MSDAAPYEAVYARPADGTTSTVARHARTAARQGYEGLVVRTSEASVPDGVAGRYGIDLVDAAEVVADDPASASGAVGRVRQEHTLVLVRGGTATMNRFAVEQAPVDVLAAPTGDGSGSDLFNHVLARAAAENGVRVEFDLGPALRRTGGGRTRAISDLRLLYDLVEQYDAPHVVSARATGHLALRAPRELAAVGDEIGLNPEFVREGLAEWGRLAERNRDRASDAFVQRGVRRAESGSAGGAGDRERPRDGGDGDDEGTPSPPDRGREGGG
ncbi:MAG: RNase P subunit p30 family protein [Haloferacaceae archaeon]